MLYRVYTVYNIKSKDLICHTHTHIHTFSGEYRFWTGLLNGHTKNDQRDKLTRFSAYIFFCLFMHSVIML